MSDILAQYSFGSASPTTTGDNLVASACSNGSLNTFNANQTGIGYASSPTLTVSPPTATTTVAAAIANSSYFQFTLTPSSGWLLRLETLSMNIARGSASGARGYSIRSSLDNYTSDIATADVLTDRTTFTPVTLSLAALKYANIRSAITFRVYIYAPGTGTNVDIDDIIVKGLALKAGVVPAPGASQILAREVAELAQGLGIGVFEPVSPQTVAGRTIWVGQLPETATEAIWLVESPSPAPHEYIDTEYPIIDFWARSPHTDRAHALLEQVFDNFHRRYGYETANWHVYFSRALGTIVDVDRDREGGKLFRLSVQFICRNLNNLS